MSIKVYIQKREKDSVSSPNLLDVATQIAISAIKPTRGNKKAVDASTINGLLTFLQSKRNVSELLLYIMRQTGRGEIDEETGKLLLRNLKDKNVEDALTLLGYVKWIYETLDGLEVDYNSVKNVKNFAELAEFLSKR